MNIVYDNDSVQGIFPEIYSDRYYIHCQLNFCARAHQEIIMVTIKEIAQIAGVSRGTVDRVLNHRGSVHPETARRVEDVASSLGYRPSKAGIALAAVKRKFKIGVIVFGTENPFFRTVLEGISEKANELAEYDCSVLIRLTAYDAYAQISAMEELRTQGIHGLVITPYADSMVACKINELIDQGIPVVTTNTDIEGTNRLAFVGSNYARDGQQAAGLMRLITGAQAHIGIITGSSQVLCHTDRIAGFTEVLSRCPGMTVIDTFENHDDDFESYELTRFFLKSHPEADAVFFTAGGVVGGCRAIMNMNRSKDLHVICFDAESTVPQLLENGLISATISQQPKRQGRLPLQLLFDHLTGGIVPADTHYVESTILIRESLP